MKFQRFYIEDALTEGKDLTLANPDLAHQLDRVFRFKEGDTIILFDGSGFDYVSKIKKIADNEVEVKVLEKKSTCFIPRRNVQIFLSITKKDNFEWALAKCTELGVTEFTPIVSERTEKKNVDMSRMQSILKESTEQAGRCSLPILNPIKTFDEVINEFGLRLFLFHPSGRVFEPDERNKVHKIMIGPEGGWTDAEVAKAEKMGAQIVTLGKQVLRAETAAVAVSSLILL